MGVDFRFLEKMNNLKPTHPSIEAQLSLMARLGGWSWAEGMREGSDVEITLGIEVGITELSYSRTIYHSEAS